MGELAWRASTAWMLAFAAVHVYWGFGGSGLLPDGVSVLDHPALFVLGLVTIPLCLAGALLARLLRPDQRPARLLARRWLLWPGTVGAAVMLVHGVTGLALVLVPWLVTGEPAAQHRWSIAHESWWLLGGLLLGATVRYHRRAVDRALERAQSLQRKSREARAVATAAQTTSTSQQPTRA